MHIPRIVTAAILACAFAGATLAEQRTENFDADPQWEGVNNRIIPARRLRVTQRFGYSPTNYAGSAGGEMGGKVTRASEPAFYADHIGHMTLDDRLSASGSFSITSTTAGGGVFFGFFRARQPGASGRPICSLGLDLDCEKSGARLAVRLITARNQSCGTFITPFIPGKFRPTPIRNDGTRYHWTLDYDPAAADGRGAFTFTIRSDAHKPGELESPDLPEAHMAEARARFPSTTTFTITLLEGFKQQGTTFDHFGLMNMMKPGGTLSIYFDDLKFLDRSQDFSNDPHWDASGNQTSYEPADVGGAHSFGFSDTNFAGGGRGEIGGTFWRTDKAVGRYGDVIAPLSLDDRLVARGKVAFTSGGPDSDMYIGFYNSQSVEQTDGLKDFVGVRVGGPTRIGHYFAPYVAGSAGVIGKVEHDAPILLPDAKPREWSIEYDPRANDGKGQVVVRLAEESVTLNLKPRQSHSARLDRFGVFTPRVGGQMIKLYLDDLTYTAGPAKP